MHDALQLFAASQNSQPTMLTTASATQKRRDRRRRAFAAAAAAAPAAPAEASARLTKLMQRFPLDAVAAALALSTAMPDSQKEVLYALDFDAEDGKVARGAMREIVQASSPDVLAHAEFVMSYAAVVAVAINELSSRTGRYRMYAVGEQIVFADKNTAQGETFIDSLLEAHSKSQVMAAVLSAPSADPGLRSTVVASLVWTTMRKGLAKMVQDNDSVMDHAQRVLDNKEALDAAVAALFDAQPWLRPL
jgi:hypothetical protein